MLRRTPPIARLYLFVAALLLALPGLGRMYEGTTGKLLVATYGVDREPFRRAVVYVVHHDLFGAHGFIVNRPEDRKATSIAGHSVPVWFGGPVRPDDPSFLMDREPEGKNPWIFPRSGESLEDVETRARVEARLSSGGKFLRGVFGYAGWTVFQLDWERLDGRWAVIDFDPALVFDTPPEMIWSKAMERARASNQNGIDTEREPI